MAQISNFAVLTAFVMVNASLIWLRRINPEHKRGFRTPLNVRNVPLPAVLGMAFSIFMLANIGLFVLAIGILVAIIGLLITFLWKGFGKPTTDQEATVSDLAQVRARRTDGGD